MEDRAEVWIYTGDGRGHFSHTFSVAAGATPTGLSLVRNPQTGSLDLLVGDPFGDVLHLQGKGDGTFHTAGSRVSLAVQDLGNGQISALIANQQTDRVTVQAAQPGSPQFVPVVTLADGTQSTLAPGAVQWAKLDKGSPNFDAVVLASGGNAVLVYRSTGFDAASNPTFAAPVSYAVGTNPVGVTIQDLNGDGVPDMVVANQGSNDVSILFGSYDANGDWVATPGPRLKSGGQGPVATTLRDMNGDGTPDLVVTNSQSGTFTVLPGVGQGFFNDTSPQVFNVPGNPVLQSPSFFGASSQGVVATADGRLIGFDLSNFDASVHTLFAPSAGTGVDAAEALADGHVVAALAGGTVVDLAPSNGGLSVNLTFQSLTGIPTAPSALSVLQGELGLQVLVTNTGGDRVFVFGVPLPPESPGVGVPAGGGTGQRESSVLPPAEAPVGPTVEVTVPRAEAPADPTVEVTPSAAGSLTLVVTLTAGPLPEVPAAAAATPPVADVAPAAAVRSAVGDVAPVVDAPAVGGVPAADVAHAAAATPATDPSAGRSGSAEGAEQVAAEPGDGSPPPGEEGIDVQQRLRGIDLYQPTPNPDRSGPMSRLLDRPGRLEQLLLTLTLDSSLPPVAGARPAPPTDSEPASPWTVLAEVVRTVDDDAGVLASAEVERAADAVFALVSAAMDVKPAPLLAWALTGLVWWPWSAGGPESERRPCEKGRKRIRVGNY